jgi:GcrA cell cycle regulator
MARVLPVTSGCITAFFDFSEGGQSRMEIMQSTNWAEEHSDALQEFLAKGMSYSRIADAINAKFRTAYSRSATIGRAKRMGLAGSDQPKDQPTALDVQASRLHRMRERYVIEFRRPMPIFERVETVRLRCVEIVPRHLALVDLEPGDCRYPYGGDEEGEAITFCGHPRRPDASYCTAHFHLTRGPGSIPERGVGTVSLRVVEAA